jgi:hypothetical protein
VQLALEWARQLFECTLIPRDRRGETFNLKLVATFSDLFSLTVSYNWEEDEASRGVTASSCSITTRRRSLASANQPPQNPYEPTSRSLTGVGGSSQRSLISCWKARNAATSISGF